ncbi:MAG: dienelactone hydrolase family protein [Verrucomicrobia bacterium]|nr:dienelactone hydrolase family protein [Verrucomicrobiota bacterium]MDA1087795.1 dienelactone hydrolase family protein [Verrucomicrobiota bacterium]
MRLLNRHLIRAACAGLLLIAPARPALAQEFGRFAAGYIAISVERPDRTTFPAYAIYPATRWGSAAALQRESGPYPVVVFGHGYLSSPIQYAISFLWLASHGYVVVAPGSAVELFPSHDAYADDFSYCLDAVEDLSRSRSSRLYRAIDRSAIGVAGHSMGGGAAILAATRDRRVGAVAVWAPAETLNVSAIEAAAHLRVPTRIVAASEDVITPVGRHALPFFRNITVPSQIVAIRGASHCGFLDIPLPDAVCGPAEIPHRRQLLFARELVRSFFDFHLKRDAGAWSRAWGPVLREHPDLITMVRPPVPVRP